jgi:8-oxo-dGTP pyrophosphatase MutT (NUDIX family)
MYLFCEYYENKQWAKKPLKNFEFVWKGQKYWYSRACAVSLFVFCKNKSDEWCVLANKRGKNTPDFKGFWNCICGYLDFHEDSIQAAQRECKEETNIFISSNNIEIYGVNSNPADNKQNVTIRHCAVITDRTTDAYQTSNKNSDKGEVDDIKWIPLSKVDEYEWAFNHRELIKEIAHAKELM